MTDRNPNSVAQPSESTRPLPGSSVSRSSHSHPSYEAAESSNAGGLRRDTSIDGPTFGWSSSHGPRAASPNVHSGEQGTQHRSHDHDAHPRRRSHKVRPNSGFLLSNAISNGRSTPNSQQRDDGRRKSRIPVGARSGQDLHGSSVDTDELASPALSGGSDTPDSTFVHPEKSGRNDDSSDGRPKSAAATRRTSRIPSLRPNSAPIDVDSTQIVSMALNLSERRLASKRIVSNPIPPRLAQLPDSVAGGSLKQHLQQQRRTSRNISPIAHRSITPRVVSTPKISSPLHPSLDHESTYTYHFSSSTLNRAQKAKEYLELMAQYRRLLLFVSPLKQESRPSTSNPPASPTSAGTPLDLLTSAQNKMIGRPYNPLQYIRNRKIRTRERRTIDGEAQGFKDIPRVTDWVDEVATVAATLLLTDSSALPTFSGADNTSDPQQLPSNIPRPVSATTKPRRPRFDWSIEPADMLADVYWIEQGDNKYLIEDRSYTKIFTPKPQNSQLATQVNDHLTFAPVSTSKEPPDSQGHNATESASGQPMKIDAETPPVSTRDRARQKLQDLRGIHHRHNSSVYGHHDFLRFRRGSSPDTSGSESDRHKRGRGGTISASGRDLLDQQMQELLAKEAKDEKAKEAKDEKAKEEPGKEIDTDVFKTLPSDIVTPDDSSTGGHSRKNSRIDTMDLLEKNPFSRPQQSSPLHSGRPSLEVPGHAYRSSVDLDSSRPVSPVMRSGRRYSGIVPTMGMSPSPKGSRPTSPSRNPFSRVKGIFRDQSRERSGLSNDSEERISSPMDSVTPFNISAITEDIVQPRRRRSKSPHRGIVTRTTNESNKSHKSVGSLKSRTDEQLGLKTLFRGSAKLDGMIRGGVNRMSDIIWKKESEVSPLTSDDESDAGSKKDPTSPPQRSNGRQRQVKNYLDIMPSFKSAAETSQDTETSSSGHIIAQAPSRSPRFDQLKPPRIDIRKASPLSSDDEQERARYPESDISEVDSRPRRSALPLDRPRKTSKELQNMLAISSHEKGTSHSSDHGHLFIPDSKSSSHPTPLSRRDIARIRTLVVCTGIKAMEIARRAHDPHPLFALDNKAAGLSWTEMSQFAQDEQANLSAAQTEIFPTTARIFSASIEHSIRKFETSASEFSTDIVPALQTRIDKAHDGFSVDLMDMARHAFDEADGVSRDIVDSQRLKVKSVVDTMDKMLRRRRRRFRWVRRAGWLAVEWVLVGLMWYVWFIVMITRIFFGMGQGVLSFFKWLFWIS